MSIQSRDDGSRSCDRHQRFNDDCRGCLAVRDCQRLMDENARLRTALQDAVFSFNQCGKVECVSCLDAIKRAKIALACDGANENE